MVWRSTEVGMEELKLLASTLKTFREEIIAIWSDRVRNSLQNRILATPMVAIFLDDLSSALKSQISEIRPKIILISQKLASENLASASMEQIIIEFNILRQVIFHVLEKEVAVPPMVRDIIYESINLGLSHIATEYTRSQLHQLEVSDERLQKISDIQPVVIAYVDQNLRYHFANTAFRDWLNLRDEEILGRTMIEVLGPTVFDTIRDKLQRALSGEVQNFHQFIPYTTGFRYVHVIYGPDMDEFGTCRGIFISVQDRTEEKLIIDSLKGVEKQFIALANSIPQIAWMAEPDGSVFWFNSKWFDYTGLTPEASLGWEFEKNFSYDFSRKAFSNYRRKVNAGTIWEENFPLKNSAGEYHWFSGKAIPIKSQSGEISRWFVTCTDYTDKKNLREALSEEKIIRSKLMASLAHDLSVPLRSAKMALSTLEDKHPDLKGEQLLNAIDLNLNLAAKLVEDLLDLNRIRAGKLIETNVEKFDLVKVIADTLRTLEEIHGKRFTLLSPERLDTYLCQNGIRRVIENLCMNAIKYAPLDEEIILEVVGGHQNLAICVQNKSINTESDFEKAFFVLQNGSASDVLKQESWDLGLTIVKGVTESLGGEISVASSDESITFKIKVPLDAREAVLLVRKKKKILIIDDLESNRYFYSRILSEAGFETTEASSGLEGLLMLDPTPDLIILDIQLPDINGFEIAKQLKKSTFKSIPIIQISAQFTDHTSTLTGLISGANYYLPTPVEPDKLIECVKMCLKVSSES